MDIHVTYRRRVQVADYEPIEYGISITDSTRDGETIAQARARVQNTAADFFNQVEAAALEDYGVSDKAVPLTMLEGADDSADGGSSRTAPPKRRSK